MTITIGTTTDETVQRAMHWHFSPETGSPFWLRRAAELPFDPLVDVRTREDLVLFPDVSDEWRRSPAIDLVPLGCRSDDWAFEVFDSGGTSGSPKRIVEATSRREGVAWVSSVLDRHGVPGVDGGDWLHIGPTGPHIVGRSVGLLARMRRGLCFTIDFDPRWVKRCIRHGDLDGVARYVDHVIDQAVDVLRRESVTVVFLTPSVLEAIAQRPEAYDLMRRQARAILWAGTALSAETLRIVEGELFPEATVVGLYGNTLMGIAPQRPRQPEDDEPCVFQSFFPACDIELLALDGSDRPVDYGERGQVRFTLLSRDMFVPNCLERDTGIRVPPVLGFPWDGVAQIESLAGAGGSDVVIGVY